MNLNRKLLFNNFRRSPCCLEHNLCEPHVGLPKGYHRIKESWYRLAEMIEGDIDAMLTAVINYYQAEALKSGDSQNGARS